MTVTSETEYPEDEITEEHQVIDFELIDPVNCAYVFSKRILISVFILSVFAVLTHWGFWDIGQYAAGWNSTAAWLGLVTLVVYRNNVITLAKDWFWITPICLVSISFSIYENPWLNHISLYILPVFIGVLCTCSHVLKGKDLLWDFGFFEFLMKKMLNPIANLLATIRQGRKYITSSTAPQKTKVFASIGKGFGLLFPVGVLVIFLLGSADHNFGIVIKKISESVLVFLDWGIIFKVLSILFLTVLLLSSVFSWRLKHEVSAAADKPIIDGVVSGIVMCGVLVLYAIFISLQFEYLLTDSLPIDFSQAEYIVKSGFWQLFLLSIFNTILFVVLYGRTSYLTQAILRVYIIASGLILLSGCWRLALYVYWYGLSYEKYFAVYTCIFSMFIFLYLLLATFISTKRNILKFIVFSSIWFYAVATITPVEKIIYKTNIYLYERGGSRINLDELSVLSVDVYSNVITDIADGRLRSHVWNFWIPSIETSRCHRKWYELNLSLLNNCP